VLCSSVISTLRCHVRLVKEGGRILRCTSDTEETILTLLLTSLYQSFPSHKLQSVLTIVDSNNHGVDARAGGLQEFAAANASDWTRQKSG